MPNTKVHRPRLQGASQEGIMAEEVYLLGGRGVVVRRFTA
jgi:hypothetical protein